ncbi:hypothetical protein Afil01_23020 [Actinorhabdospora filicis]|uniref:Nucleotidyl transferase AbiEii toxin, Type IV TA system n=1 Tax=Actinorhabdospora filicis TaxID=1785913 RepID=A0A9W6WAC5_9ACTN|nr:nucleotidyl transferase AbiEii/AbiGii toxin family protein [Actinorhabdospora filicis]GLZ77495.1 hypothetical protein Afil01_23020 [Actinorhabdospora filicis]
MRDVLAAIAASPVADRLVLRGSVAMRDWFGGVARVPGDIDLIDTGEGGHDEVVAAVVAAVGPVRVEEELLDYGEAVGRRLVFESGVRVEISFGEGIPRPTTEIEVGGVRLRCVDRETALVWKIQWLADGPVGLAKDLYDAVLLAEAVPLDRVALDWGRNGYFADWSTVNVWDWDIEGWAELGVEGDEDDWRDRLVAALKGSAS